MRYYSISGINPQNCLRACELVDREVDVSRETAAFRSSDLLASSLSATQQETQQEASKAFKARFAGKAGKAGCI